MIGNNYLLWEDDKFIVVTLHNPHIPYSEGPHILIKSRQEIEPNSAWENPMITGKMFELAAKVSKVMEDLELSPWFNLQANGNWGLLPEATPFFHVHIYGRNRNENWGKPISLPVAPGTYKNDPMPEVDRNRLAEKLKIELR
jgi:diadenosine tetraphosphate (Ap4A) HIT family hydrolase